MNLDNEKEKVRERESEENDFQELIDQPKSDSDSLEHLVEEPEMEVIPTEASAKDNVVEMNEIDIQLSESEEDDGDEEVKDVRFLTDLFGGEQEETYTKMKIYITQENDTIESIAKRYEMSTLQLIKDNQLTGEGLEEGQLLYIQVQTEK